MTIQKVQFRESKYQSLVEHSFRDYFKDGERYVIEHYQGASENKRGYDLEVRSLVPLFLQLKVCHFTPSFSKSPLISTRKTLGILDNPGHYHFGLHPDFKTKKYKQHNLLFALHQQGDYARYVAPLFHTRRAIEHYAYQKPHPKWGFHYGYLIDAELKELWTDYFDFEHSISIMPHKNISDAISTPHGYCYNTSGQISFHSEPELLEQATFNLFDSIRYFTRRALLIAPRPLLSVNSSISAALASALASDEDGRSEIDTIPVYVRSALSEQGSPHLRFRRLSRFLEIRYQIKTILLGYDW